MIAKISNVVSGVRALLVNLSNIKDWWKLGWRMINQETGFILAMMRIKGERKVSLSRSTPVSD